MGKHINTQTVLDLLDMCVAERGSDYVYKPDSDTASCLNWHGDAVNGEPGCIVGLALYLFGVPADLLAENRGAIRYIQNSLTVEGVTMDPNAMTLLEFAQTAQDRDMPWGLVRGLTGYVAGILQENPDA
jgi:hypothetical protein